MTMPQALKRLVADETPKAPVRTLKVPRSVALWIVSVLATLGIVISFAESYRALYWWAQTHQVHGAWATIWPLQIDSFVMVGELALFVALTDAWKVRHRALPWLITLAGLAVSVAGNVGHAPTHDIFTRLTFAVPSITAYAMLAAALGLLKRVIANLPKAKPGPKPGTVRKPRTPRADPEAALKAAAFATLPLDDGRLFRPMVASGSGPAAPQMPEDWDPDSTNAFPRLGQDGLPVDTPKAA